MKGKGLLTPLLSRLGMKVHVCPVVQKGWVTERSTSDVVAMALQRVLVTYGLAEIFLWAERLCGSLFREKKSLALSYLWLTVTFKNIFQDRKLEKEFTLDENNFLKLGIFQEL